MSNAILASLDTYVQDLRVERGGASFRRTLAHVVRTLGQIRDLPPARFTRDDLTRVRELVDETTEAIETRIDSGDDSDDVRQHLAGTIYEIRRRAEAVETWFRHFNP